MNQFERVKDTGITLEQDENFNIIRGCVMGSFLENPIKKELMEFINELIEYLEESEEY